MYCVRLIQLLLPNEINHYYYNVCENSLKLKFSTEKLKKFETSCDVKTSQLVARLSNFLSFSVENFNFNFNLSNLRKQTNTVTFTC